MIKIIDDKHIYKIYKYTFPDGMIYIGMTKHSIKERLWAGYKHNQRMIDALASIDKKSLKIEILEDGLTQAEANDAEIKYIEIFNSTDPDVGYNISKGGNRTFAGLKHAEEYKKYMSDLLKGRKFSEEHCKRLSESLKGKLVGEKNPMYGKPKSAITIQRQYDSHRSEMIPVVQKNLKGNIIGTYFSMHEAARKTGVNRNCIKACLIGKQQSSKGFLWEYADTTYDN